MAQQSIVVPSNTNSPPGNYASSNTNVFQGANTYWLGFGAGGARMILGNFFLGLQSRVVNIFDAQIPPGSTIVSATYEMTPFATQAGLFTTQINTPNRDQSLQVLDPMNKPFEPFEGYRQDLWSNAQVGALSTTFTAVFGTSVTTNTQWIMRQITAPGATLANRDHMAQLITTRTGNMTIASLFWDLFRTGNPTGTLRVRIQGVTLDRGVKIPDGIDVPNGVSNTILCSSVPLVATLTNFTFPTNPTLVALTEYFILIEPTYPANNVDYISVRHQNAFLIANGGGLRHYGEGLLMDWQNFPGNVDNDTANVAPFIPGEDVAWAIDSQTINVVETSPDLTSLLQAQIDNVGYTIDSGIIISMRNITPDPNQNRLINSNDAPSIPAVLRVTYDEPVPPADDKLADPSTGGRHRIIEPWEPAYYRFKYGKDPAKDPASPATKKRPEIEPERPSFMPELIARDAANAQLAKLERKNAQTERDILELRAYIAEVAQGIEDDIAADLVAQEFALADQEAIIARLEENMALAREALLLALESRRRHQNQMAAIEAAIRIYY